MTEEKSLTYEIDMDNNLITEVFTGEYSREDLIAFQNKVFADKRYNNALNVLLDLRKSIPKFSVEEIEDIITIILKGHEDAEKAKIAFVTELPKQVVDAMITVDAYKTRKINAELKIFSTIEAALGWLNASR